MLLASINSLSNLNICNEFSFIVIYLQESYIRGAIGSPLLQYSLMPAHAVSCLIWTMICVCCLIYSVFVNGNEV